MYTPLNVPDIHQWKASFLASIHRWNGASCDYSKPAVLQLLDTLYMPEYAKDAGHDLLFALLQRGGVQVGEKALIKRLISDGADWYIALRQLRTGPFDFMRFTTYQVLRDRQPDSVKEFDLLLEIGLERGINAVVRAIIKAMGKNRIISNLVNPTVADRVYQIYPQSYLRNHISPAMLASSLETDLGI